LNPLQLPAVNAREGEGGEKQGDAAPLHPGAKSDDRS